MKEAPASWHELVVPESFDNDIIPFWDGLKDHQFLLYTCGKCERQFWPATLCPDHDDVTFADMSWQPSSGRGRIFSWVRPHRFNNAAYAPSGPYLLMLVELEEGPLFPTRLSGTPPQDVVIGTHVEIDYVDVDATGMTLPLFRLPGDD